jgi:hypothetical protein
MPFSDPITAGGILVQPGIQSPDFSQAGQTGWAVLADGTAFFFSLTAVGPISTGSTVTVGRPGGSEIVLNPNVNQAFDVTTAIAGFLQAVGQFITSDGSEVVAGALGALLLGTGTATKMATALTSAFGSQGAAILLESQNDGGTDTPVITFGTTTSPDGGATVVYTPIATLSPYAFILYSGQSGQTVVTKTSGSGTIPIPAGVTTALGECWGNGGNGGVDGNGASAGGGGSGEYAAEPALVVPSGGTVAYSAVLGSPITLAGSVVTVTAHQGGMGAQSAGGIAGAGSTNTTHFPGAAGGLPDTVSGCAGGGAGSAGPGGAGNPGGNGSTIGGPGGFGAPGGGSGGRGADPSFGPHIGQPPGGGGGGGIVLFGGSGGVAGRAQVRLTYSTGAPGILVSFAAAAGTDQFGTAYPAGFSLTGASGLQRNVSGGQLATVVPVVVTQAVLTSLASFTINASDAVVGSVYKLTAYGVGTWGSAQTGLTWQGTFAGVGGGTETIPAAFLPINTPFRWQATMTAICVTAGAGGTWTVNLKGSLNAFTFGLATTIPFSCSVNGVVTQSTLVANIMAMQCNWGTASIASITASASYPDKVA